MIRRSAASIEASDSMPSCLICCAAMSSNIAWRHASRAVACFFAAETYMMAVRSHSRMMSMNRSLIASRSQTKWTLSVPLWRPALVSLRTVVGDVDVADRSSETVFLGFAFVDKQLRLLGDLYCQGMVT